MNVTVNRRHGKARKMLRAGILWPRRVRARFMLPKTAKVENRRDASGWLEQDPGVDRAIDEGIAWLCRAQDCSTSRDSGVARHYSLLTGWGSSYPETTGYIIPTLLTFAKTRGDAIARTRAKRMLDWLISIQFPEGGFQAGTIGTLPTVPVTFNTGQVLLGLASGVDEFNDYEDAMCRAADWLVRTQDSDGCWRKHPTPRAAPGEKTYETHVAWGLLEAARLEPDKPYAEAALANVRWALRWQRANGWFENCCLTEDLSQPLTHTLGYALRGIIEAYRFAKDDSFLQAARRTGDGLLTALKAEGFLPGRLGSNWQGSVPWACLTGSAQISSCWLLLYRATGDCRYRDAAYAVNRYLRRTMKTGGPLETRGAIKGSYPISGAYGPYEYLNWACKFFVDANLLEKEIRNEERTTATVSRSFIPGSDDTYQKNLAQA